MACGDYDGDGLDDLYAVVGDGGANVLLRNRGDGSFEEVGARAGVAFRGEHGAGPVFADVDGDGWLDLLVGGIEDTRARLLRNRHDGTFADVTTGSGLDGLRVLVTASFGDYDVDGDLDLAMGRWGSGPNNEHLYQNDGRGRFTPIGKALGLEGFGPHHVGMGDFSFTPNFVDIDDDGLPDLLYASDYTTSQYFLNRGAGGFQVMRPPWLIDRNGMGAAIGDYDNDGRLDWFVTSIFNPTIEFPPQIGNRLYRNIGGGQFEDTTEKAGVKDGSWGWATCFADFNNDGLLDIFHVNGFNGRPGAEEAMYANDASRLFISDGNGAFSERSAALGLKDNGQGRGLVCFDYDRDGDIDLFIANSEQPPELWRNDLGDGSHFLDVKLAGKAPNTEGIGARVYLTAGGTTWMRELRAGSNYASQDPAIAHFGLAKVTRVDTLRVLWLDRAETVQTDLAVDQRVVVTHP